MIGVVTVPGGLQNEAMARHVTDKASECCPSLATKDVLIVGSSPNVDRPSSVDDRLGLSPLDPAFPADRVDIIRTDQSSELPVGFGKRLSEVDGDRKVKKLYVEVNSALIGRALPGIFQFHENNERLGSGINLNSSVHNGDISAQLPLGGSFSESNLIFGGSGRVPSGSSASVPHLNLFLTGQPKPMGGPPEGESKKGNYERAKRDDRIVLVFNEMPETNEKRTRQTDERALKSGAIVVIGFIIVVLVVCGITKGKP